VAFISHVYFPLYLSTQSASYHLQGITEKVDRTLFVSITDSTHSRHQFLPLLSAHTAAVQKTFIHLVYMYVTRRSILGSRTFPGTAARYLEHSSILTNNGLTFLENSCNYDPPGILLEFRPPWMYSWNFIMVLKKLLE